jgi:N-acetylmuramoyl-L-alanine amidase CwlA
MITNHILKHNIAINKATVISNDILSKGASISGKNQSIKYITIHNTGLYDVKANNFHRSLKRENGLSNGRKASWHLCVDDKEIYQHIGFDKVAWHSGNSTGNNSSIGIECTQWNNKNKQELTWNNAAALTAKLLKEYNLSIDKVVQHNKWSGKNCPQLLREKKHGFDWSWFISRVKHFLEEITTNKTTITTNNKANSYKVKITADVLNVRSGPNTSYKVNTTVKKGEVYTIVKEVNGWGHLKSGAGYISLKYTTKV